MKKLAVCLLIITGLGSAAHAQVRLGIKAGAGLATLTGTGLEATKSRITPLGGVTFNLPVTSDGFFSVQPELLYSQKGDKYGSAQTTRLHYVDVPVMARINADGLIFELGPQVGYLARVDNKLETPSGPTVSHYTDGYRRFDVGYVAGVGYQLSSGPGIGLRYNGGLISPYNYSTGNKVRNSVFQLFLTYAFGGK